MLQFFDPFRDLTFVSVILKLLLSFICGTLIGIERTYKRRPAGLRTHILICLGATITTLTGHYVYLSLGMPTDVQRIGAQVISGLGFIGAGTILVTKNQTVTGLTTAAGLWSSGIIGLAIGAGFYEGALITTILILVVELLLTGVENRMLNKYTESGIYITYSEKRTLDSILLILNENNINLINLDLNKQKDKSTKDVTLMGFFTIRYKDITDYETTIEKIAEIRDIKKIQDFKS